MIRFEYYLELPIRTSYSKAKGLCDKLQSFCLDIPCESIILANLSTLTTHEPSWGKRAKKGLGFTLSFPAQIPVFNFLIYNFPPIHKGVSIPWFFKGVWEIPKTGEVATARAIQAIIKLLDKSKELGFHVSVYDETGFWRTRKNLLFNIRLLNSNPDLRDIH